MRGSSQCLRVPKPKELSVVHVCVGMCENIYTRVRMCTCESICSAYMCACVGLCTVCKDVRTHVCEFMRACMYAGVNV